MRFTLALAALALAACSSDPAPPADAGQDVGGDLGTDTGSAVDTGIDAPRDTTPTIDDPPVVTDTGPVVDTRGDVSSEPGDDASLPADSDTADATDAPDAVDATDAPEVGIACPMGLGDCDGNAANGCEVDFRSNPDHCGGCGMACLRAPQIIRACRSSVCDAPRCASGRGDCNNDLADGCEVNITTDNRNCGACGRACSTADGGLGRCSAGSCF